MIEFPLCVFNFSSNPLFSGSGSLVYSTSFDLPVRGCCVRSFLLIVLQHSDSKILKINIVPIDCLSTYLVSCSLIELADWLGCVVYCIFNYFGYRVYRKIKSNSINICPCYSTNRVFFINKEFLFLF